MISSKLAMVVVGLGVLGSFGCVASAPGSEGESEVTAQGQGAMTIDDVAGLASCDTKAGYYADCIVDPSYPVYSSYLMEAVPVDGSKGWTFVVSTKVTGKPTSAGTPVRLYGGDFTGAFSWAPAPEPPKVGGVTATKLVRYGLIYTCPFPKCPIIIRGKKGPGAQ